LKGRRIPVVLESPPTGFVETDPAGEDAEDADEGTAVRVISA
jgi:hypothetical protein